MPTYRFACTPCGAFDVVRTMAETDRPATCPRCGTVGRRIFGSPALAALDPSLRRALDASGRSADAPEVVSSVPGRSPRATAVTRDPRHARLPRP